MECKPAEGAASEISPTPKNFFAKASFTQRLPLCGTEPFFGQVFGRGGMTKFSKWKVPPTGGSRTPIHDCLLAVPHGSLPIEMKTLQAAPEGLPSCDSTAFVIQEERVLAGGRDD